MRAVMSSVNHSRRSSSDGACDDEAWKTLADCFRFRNKIGIDTAVEALRAYCQRNKITVDALMH